MTQQQRIAALIQKLEETEREARRYRHLLERVRAYAVVDPLGNPGALPSSHRMRGIENDIDTVLEEYPHPAPLCRCHQCGAGAGEPCKHDCPSRAPALRQIESDALSLFARRRFYAR